MVAEGVGEGEGGGRGSNNNDDRQWHQACLTREGPRCVQS